PTRRSSDLLAGVDEGEAVGARVDAGQRYGDDVRDVGGELGEDGDAGPHLVADRPHDGRGGGRVPGEHAAAVLDVGAGDVDLDAGDARHVAEPAAEVGVLLDAAAGDGDDRAHVPLEEPGKVTFQERFD